MTLEDETGFVNLVLWENVFQKYKIIAKTTTIQSEILNGTVGVDGSVLTLIGFFAMLDEPEPTYNIVTP